MAKKEEKHEDNYGTVVNMNVEGMKGYVSPKEQRLKKDVTDLKMTKKEKRALFWGSFLAMIPTLLYIMVGFGLTILLVWAWLRQSV